MTNIAMPPVDQAVIARRDEIVAGLVSILGAEHVISAEDERRAVRGISGDQDGCLHAHSNAPPSTGLPATALSTHSDSEP